MQASIDIIERNVITTNTWLKDIVAETGDIDEQQAWGRLRAVLHTLRDRILVDEAAHFGAQLPTLIRGLFFEQWKPAATPQKWRHREEILDAVTERMEGTDIDAEEVLTVVLRVMGRHVGPEELNRVKEMHPKEAWDLWPQ